MLAGTRFYMIDRKGRLVLPADFRRQLGPGAIVLAPGPGGAVLVLTRGQWQQLLRRHAHDPERRAYILSGSTRVMPEAAGRVMIPTALREMAGLTPGTEVAVSGIGNGIALASRSVWDARMRAIERGFLAELDRPAPRLWTDGRVTA